MKICCLLLTPPADPGSRYGVYSLLPDLRECGIDVSVYPFWDPNAYSKIRINGPRSAAYVLELSRSYLRRLSEIVKASRADAVWIQRYAAPMGTGLLGGVLKAAGRPLVFGYDDAVYLPSGKKNLLRTWFGGWRDINWMISNSREVIARNGGLAAYARRYNRRVSLIPVGIDVSHYDHVLADLGRKSDADSTLILGWIGTPATAPYLELIRPALEKLGREGRVELRVIGGSGIHFKNVLVKNIVWNQETEVQELARADIGIAPMPDDEWARGKSGLKVIQYMGCGLPVVASAAGAHLVLMTSGKHGFLVQSTDEWLQALRTLRNDSNLRSAMGQAGRQTVRLKHDFPLIARAHATVFFRLGRS